MARSIALDRTTGVAVASRRMFMTAVIFVGILATLAVSSTLLAGISPIGRPASVAPPAVIDDWFNDAASAAGAKTGAVDDWFNDAVPAIRPPLVDDWFIDR